jgi:hypothetical protein
MNADVLNITPGHLKQMGIDIFNSLNREKINIPLDMLEFRSTGDDSKVLLQDPITKAGVILNKINISDLFPKTISIRDFKGTVKTTAKMAYSSDVSSINSRLATAVVTQEADILDGATMFSQDAVRDFVTFCRVYGFYELKLTETYLAPYDGKLLIAPSPTHKLFTGYIEVLV